MSVNPATFCLAPWTHATVNNDASMVPCCASTAKSNITYENYATWWNGDDMRSLRKDLSSGHKNKNCNLCWMMEESGKESLRLSYNNLFKKYANYQEIKNADNNNYVSSEPVTWDLRLGNLCNLKCVMCDATFSDKIADEIKQHSLLIDQKFPNKLTINHVYRDWTNTDQAAQFLNHIVPRSKWIKLQGGEPFAQKNIRDVIENFNNVILAVTTNGTVLDERLYNALAQLPRVEISISVEAIGNANDIIRYGSDWNDIKINLLRLKQLPNVDVQINHVLQITSVFFLADVLQFCEDNNIYLHLNKLYKPEYLSLSACPKKYVDKMVMDISQIKIKHPKNQYIKTFVENVCTSTTYDPKLNNEFDRYVDLLDHMRPKKFFSILKFKEPTV